MNVGVEPEAAKTQRLSSPEERGTGRGGIAVDGRPARLLIVDQGSRSRSSTSSEGLPLEMVSLLESRGYQVHCADSDGAAKEALGGTPPELLILAVSRDRPAGSGGPVAELRTAAQNLGIPVLEVLDSGTDLGSGFGPSPEADDWVLRSGGADELAARVARLLRNRTPVIATASRSPAAPVDPRFTSLVVHDLRTPLNVIGLSFRMIEQVLPRGRPRCCGGRQVHRGELPPARTDALATRRLLSPVRAGTQPFGQRVQPAPAGRRAA